MIRFIRLDKCVLLSFITFWLVLRMFKYYSMLTNEFVIDKNVNDYTICQITFKLELYWVHYKKRWNKAGFERTSQVANVPFLTQAGCCVIDRSRTKCFFYNDGNNKIAMEQHEKSTPGETTLTVCQQRIILLCYRYAPLRIKLRYRSSNRNKSTFCLT